MSTASDQYFLSYVKKNYRGGQIDPPQAGIGLKGVFVKMKIVVLLTDPTDRS